MKKIFLIVLCCSAFLGFSAEHSTQVELSAAWDVGYIASIESGSVPYASYQPMNVSLRLHNELANNLYLYVALNSIVISNSMNLGVSRPVYLTDSFFLNFMASGVFGRQYINGISISMDNFFFGWEGGLSLNFKLSDSFVLIAGYEGGIAELSSYGSGDVTKEAAYKNVAYFGIGLQY